MEIAGETPDNELIARFCKGDEKAFEQLYTRYKRLLYGYLNNLLCGNSAEMDDVFSATWMQVVEKLPKYRHQGKFTAWLFRIARNIYIDRWRRERPDRFADVAEEDNPALQETTELSPDRIQNNMELRAIITEAVNRLPELQREVFLLRDRDLAFREIAEIQHCPLNTVLSRMHYAIKNLRSMLSNIEGEK